MHLKVNPKVHPLGLHKCHRIARRHGESARPVGRLPALHVGRSGSRPHTDVSARAAGDGRGSDLGPDPVSLMGEGGEGGQWRDGDRLDGPGEKRVDYGWDALLVGVAGQT